MNGIARAVRALNILLPPLNGELQGRRRGLDDLPVWLRGTLDIFTIEGAAPYPPITLLCPREGLTFDQTLNAYRVASAKTGPRTLLIADALKAKLRPLLVKFRVPFIFRDEAVFAPDLGLVFKDLQQFTKGREPVPTVVRDELHPLSVKLTAAYLSRLIPAEITLRNLHRRLIDAGAQISPAKLSLVLNELAGVELLDTHGRGPLKSFSFRDPKLVWDTFSYCKVRPVVRVIYDRFQLLEKTDYVLAGESALAEQSDLNAPNVLTIATIRRIYREKQSKRSSSIDADAREVHIQIWKEDPRLFSIGNGINPIELYLSLRAHSDERIQLALQKILSRYDLPLMEKANAATSRV